MTLGPQWLFSAWAAASRRIRRSSAPGAVADIGHVGMVYRIAQKCCRRGLIPIITALRVVLERQESR